MLLVDLELRRLVLLLVPLISLASWSSMVRLRRCCVDPLGTLRLFCSMVNKASPEPVLLAAPRFVIPLLAIPCDAGISEAVIIIVVVGVLV
jgi:hypothetical protein